MGVEIGKTRISLSSRSLDQLGARAIVRFFADLDTLARAEPELPLGPKRTGPSWPGDAVVRPMRAQPGCFRVDFCLEWRNEAPASPTERESVIVRALHQAGINVVAEARRWACPTLGIPLPPAAAAPKQDRLRFRALCDGLVSGLKQPGPGVVDIWIVTGAGDGPRKQPFAEELLAAMGRRPTRTVHAVPADAAPALSEAPTTQPDRPAPVVLPPPPIQLSCDGTFVDAPIAQRFLHVAHDEAITTRMPYPIAATWHVLTRRVDPVARLQALLHAGEVTLRTLGAFLLTDWLRGAPDPQTTAAVSKLRRPALGDWSKAIEALGRALVARSTPSFFSELGEWLGARADDDAHRLTRALVELRNATQHGRIGMGRGAVEQAAAEAEMLLRRLLDSLRWLERYRIVVPNDMALIRRRTFSGHLVIYRGRERYPRFRAATWCGDLIMGGCYLLAPDRTRALGLAPFFAIHPDAGSGDDTLLLLEALPDLKKAQLRQPAGKTDCALPLSFDAPNTNASNGFWTGGQGERLVTVELLDEASW